jgi:hypothetical protein
LGDCHHCCNPCYNVDKKCASWEAKATVHKMDPSSRVNVSILFTW